MFSRRILIAVGMFLAASLMGSPAYAAKGSKKKSTAEHAIHGTVVHVQANPNGTGVITVKTHGSKKKKSNGKTQAHHHEHKFTVSTSTTFFFGTNSKRTPTTFSSVHHGEHVTIMEKNHQADVVEIHRHMKKKK